MRSPIRPAEDRAGRHRRTGTGTGSTCEDCAASARTSPSDRTCNTCSEARHVEILREDQLATQHRQWRDHHACGSAAAAAVPARAPSSWPRARPDGGLYQPPICHQHGNGQQRRQPRTTPHCLCVRCTIHAASSGPARGATAIAAHLEDRLGQGRAGRPRPSAPRATTPGGRSDEPVPTSAAATEQHAVGRCHASSSSDTAQRKAHADRPADYGLDACSV